MSRVLSFRKKGYYDARRKEGEVWWEVIEAHDGADPLPVGTLISDDNLRRYYETFDEGEQ